MSYWPPPPFFISETISSDEPAYLALTMQPVCCFEGLDPGRVEVALPGDQVELALALAHRLQHRKVRGGDGEAGRARLRGRAAAAASQLPPLALADGVLLELLHAATARDSAAMPAAITLAERTGLAGRTVRRCLNLLMVLALPCPGDDRAGRLLGNREGLPFLPGDAHPRAVGPGPGQATGSTDIGVLRRLTVSSPPASSSTT